MSTYYNNGYAYRSELDFLFETYRNIQTEVEAELVRKAQELSETPSNDPPDYRYLAKCGVSLLQRRIYCSSRTSSTTKDFVQEVFISTAKRSFNSPYEFGGKLDRILKKLPEIQKEPTPCPKPYSFTVNVNWGELKYDTVNSKVEL